MRCILNPRNPFIKTVLSLSRPRWDSAWVRSTNSSLSTSSLWKKTFLGWPVEAFHVKQRKTCARAFYSDSHDSIESFQTPRLRLHSGRRFVGKAPLVHRAYFSQDSQKNRRNHGPRTNVTGEQRLSLPSCNGCRYLLSCLPI
jgi:hypothetical protein